jgi:hypothetical protein
MPKKVTAHHRISMTPANPGQHKMLSHGAILKKPGGTVGSGIKLVIAPAHHVRHHKHK